MGLEGVAVDGPSSSQGAMKPRSLNAPTKVVVIAATRGPSGATAMRHGHSLAFTALTAAVSAGHVGRGPGLIDEGEAPRIEIGPAL